MPTIPQLLTYLERHDPIAIIAWMLVAVVFLFPVIGVGHVLLIPARRLKARALKWSQPARLGVLSFELAEGRHKSAGFDEYVRGLRGMPQVEVNTRVLTYIAKMPPLTEAETASRKKERDRLWWRKTAVHDRLEYWTDVCVFCRHFAAALMLSLIVGATSGLGGHVLSALAYGAGVEWLLSRGACKSCGSKKPAQHAH